MSISILEQVQKVITKKKGLEPGLLTPDARFEQDLGLDSLDRTELIMEFESHFGVVIDDRDMDRLQTVGDVVLYLEKG
jgi:acyl carrier protein